MKYPLFVLGWLRWHLKAGVWWINISLKIFFGISLDNEKNHGNDRGDMADFTYPEPRTYRRYLG